jgi:hypothetical protein
VQSLTIKQGLIENIRKIHYTRTQLMWKYIVSYTIIHWFLSSCLKTKHVNHRNTGIHVNEG